VRNNFFVSYDLMRPGQDYNAVHDAIKSLGRWYHLQESVFYVNTSYTARECDVIVGRALDANDRLLIADSRYAVVRGVSQADLDAINAVWLASPATYAA
jgi:hypothetical protein